MATTISRERELGLKSASTVKSIKSTMSQLRKELANQRNLIREYKDGKLLAAQEAGLLDKDNQTKHWSITAQYSNVDSLDSYTFTPRRIGGLFSPTIDNIPSFRGVSGRYKKECEKHSIPEEIFLELDEVIKFLKK